MIPAFANIMTLTPFENFVRIDIDDSTLEKNAQYVITAPSGDDYLGIVGIDKTIIDAEPVTGYHCYLFASVKNFTEGSCVVWPPTNSTFSEKMFSGTSDCNDCIPPTFGVDSAGKRWVKNGFSINAERLNVELFETEMIVQKFKVNDTIHVELFVYENRGPDQIEAVKLGLGTQHGKIINDSPFILLFWQDFQGKTKYQIDRNDLGIELVSLDSKYVKCEYQLDCLKVDYILQFRKSFDLSMISVESWDSRKNNWQNYFVPGLVVLDSQKSEKIIENATIVQGSEKFSRHEMDSYWLIEKEQAKAIEKLQEIMNTNTLWRHRHD